nr:angiopoietin-related protein 1-like [Drosophila takahashii]
MASASCRGRWPWDAKDSQIDGLNNQIRSNAEKITNITDALAKCNPQDSCPIEGPSGIYSMKIRGMNTFEAPCNSKGWLTIQKRFDGSEKFARNWNNFKKGFGNIMGEFFIGLERLHVMTEARPHELYISLGMVNGSKAYAHYDDFKIASEEELYELKSLGIYSGTAGDSLTYHKNKRFSTFDRKNDEHVHNCANGENGGWWYKSCSQSRLNGKFYKEGHTHDNKTNGISWGSWHNYDFNYSLTFVEMMIRPKTL